MKIVLSVSHYGPGYVGGVEVHTEQIAKWLISRGHVVDVVCIETIDAGRHLSVQTENRDGVVVHRVGLKLAGTAERIGLRYRDDAFGDWFGEFLMRSRPDVLHSQSCYLLTASTLEAARRVGLPIVLTLHDYWFFCPRITLLRSNGERCVGVATPADCTWCLMGERRRYKLLEFAAAKIGKPRLQGKHNTGPLGWPLDPGLRARIADRQSYLDAILRRTDQVLIPAPLAGELLLARGFPSARVRLMPYGLDLSRWKGKARTTGHDRLRIGYLGQIASHKGIHILIEAFQRLPAESPAELHIFGDGTHSPEYAKKLRRLAAGNRRIHLRGRYENHEVEDVLSRLDVVVVTSTWFEVHPLVIMEAFAAKVPVIASRLPNMQYQLRDEVDGLHFAPGDVSDLARQLRRLVDDPDLVRRLAKNIGPVRTLDHEMAETESVYQSVVAGARNDVTERLLAIGGQGI